MKVFKNQRKISASSKEIFKAFEDQALLAKWWGPDGFTTTTNAFEFKPKGKWEFMMHGPDGTDYPNEIIFQEITEPNKIVMRHSVEPYFTATVTIEDVKGGAFIKTLITKKWLRILPILLNRQMNKFWINFRL
jgi:uncharacterized protein YndB with AHSA1/START domain